MVVSEEDEKWAIRRERRGKVVQHITRVHVTCCMFLTVKLTEDSNIYVLINLKVATCTEK